jgi:hypothetical protein
MNYIIFQDFSDRPMAVLFPKRIGYEEMREQMPYSTVLSAGCVDIRDGSFHCSGAAPELGVSAREGDAEVILHHFSGQDEAACNG